jgi:hypothetical protein
MGLVSTPPYGPPPEQPRPPYAPPPGEPTPPLGPAQPSGVYAGYRPYAPPVLPAAPPEPSRSWQCDARVGAAVLGLVTAAGLLAAVVWWALAPTPTFHVVQGGIVLAQPEGSAWVAAEGWFAVVAAVFGIASAAVAYRWTRRSGVAVVVALALGGLLASLVMWRVGSWLGPDPVAVQVKGARPTDALHLPLELRAKGVLLIWSLVSVVVSFGLVAGFDQPERPPAPSWRPWGEAPQQPR